MFNFDSKIFTKIIDETSNKILQINIIGFRDERISIPHKTLFNYCFQVQNNNNNVKSITEYINEQTK